MFYWSSKCRRCNIVFPPLSETGQYFGSIQEKKIGRSSFIGATKKD
jgi:hypothetical protein